MYRRPHDGSGKGACVGRRKVKPWGWANAQVRSSHTIPSPLGLREHSCTVAMRLTPEFGFSSDDRSAA